VLNSEQARRPAMIILNYSKLSGEKRREYNIAIVFLSLLPVLPLIINKQDDFQATTISKIFSSPHFFYRVDDFVFQFRSCTK
jgi:hypothetical protein